MKIIEEELKKQRPNLSTSSLRTYSSTLKNLYFKVFDENDEDEIDIKKFKQHKKILDFSYKNRLLIIDQFGAAIYNNQNSRINYLTNYGFDNASINEVFYDNDDLLWVADSRYGLIKSGGANWSPNEQIAVNGPKNNFSNDIEIKDGTLMVAPINLGPTFTNQFRYIKPNIYNRI
jgi:hypothetical protein